MMKPRISQRERNRRREQRQRQWEKDNPDLARKIQEFARQPPVDLVRRRIAMIHRSF